MVAGHWSPRRSRARRCSKICAPSPSLDVETTGMNVPRATIASTEIAVVVVHGDAPRRGVLDSLVNPGRPIPSRICELTGITDAMVAGAPTFAQVADQVVAALAGRKVFVAHNARFDWGFVGAEVKRARDLPRPRWPASLHRVRAGSPSRRRRAVVFTWRARRAFRPSEFSETRSIVPLAMRWSPGMLLERLPSHARERGARTLSDLEVLHRTPMGEIGMTLRQAQGDARVTTTNVGRLTVHALETGIQRLDGGAMFGVVPKPLWERRIPADERNRIRMAMRGGVFIEHDDGLVPVDCGLREQGA